MPKHKHYDMIVAKAENMDLVKFEKNDGIWRVCSSDIIHMNPDKEYFLCLPQHNEKGQCLHWLNGGALDGTIDRVAIFNSNNDRWGESFRNDHPMMNENVTFDIIKNKVKRIAVYDEAADKFEETAFKTMKEAKESIGYSDAQFIELDVEV